MTWSEAEQRFAETLPGYESRPEQQNLAGAIEYNFETDGHLMAQAGTGTGKSLAALVPAIDHAKVMGMPVVVSTATKALQDQYAGKDLPFLAKTLGGFTFAVLKGRSNYLCRAKLAELANGGAPSIVNGNSLMEELESDPNHTGDFDDLITEVDFRDKSKLTTSSDECPGKNECPFGEVCFAEMAKSRAKEADVVVVNHALLVTDLVVRLRTENRGGMLPEYCGVVVDEAHELEEYATSTLGNEFTQRSLTTFASEAANFLDDPRTVLATNSAAVNLFESLERYRGKDKTKSLTDRALLDHEQQFVAAINAIRDLRTSIFDRAIHGDDEMKGKRKRLLKRAATLTERLVDVLTAEAGDLVRWVEFDEKRGTILKYAPLAVAPFLRANLWSFRSGEDQELTQRAAVLLSATLALGSDFSYIANRLGVDSYTGFDAGTPFDYPKQSALYVPLDCDPTEGYSWKAKVNANIGELVRTSGGRALLLFTSRTAMNEAHAATAELIERDGYTVLKQGDRPNRQLAEIFKTDEHSVLFALKSFMTGIDVQGDALRLVVIDKLPFPVPTDIIVKARADAVDAQVPERQRWTKGSFPVLTIPAMALTLMQAFGRLIRTKQDEGLVVILDSRLHTKKYGRTILGALPPARRLNTLPEALSYLRELERRRG